MAHIERGKCKAISSSDLADMRVKKLEFAVKLKMLEEERKKELSDAGEIPIAIGIKKNDPSFGRHLGVGPEHMKHKSSAKIEAESDGAKLNFDKDFPHIGIEQFRRGDSKSLDRLTEENLRALTINDAGTTNPWAVKKDWASQAPPPVRPTEAQLLAAHEPSKSKADVRDPNDPDSPNFTVARFWNEILGKFKCPHVKCG
jgi:hypothetical protein